MPDAFEDVGHPEDLVGHDVGADTFLRGAAAALAQAKQVRHPGVRDDVVDQGRRHDLAS